MFSFMVPSVARVTFQPRLRDAFNVGLVLAKRKAHDVTGVQTVSFRRLGDR